MQIIAISLETAIQNGGIAFIVLSLTFPSPYSDMGLLPVFSFIFLSTGQPCPTVPTQIRIQVAHWRFSSICNKINQCNQIYITKYTVCHSTKNDKMRSTDTRNLWVLMKKDQK